ncbi:MAG: gamma-glutamyl-gamma-aminobutyrate hydrolase family protein [Pyrinomonadaceae bacterium]
MRNRPRIGITMRLEMETRRFYLGRDYSEAVEACGGVPVHLSLIPKADYIVDALEGLDGILLPGSNTDTDPAYYGEEPHPKLGTVIPEKDETDRLVLDEAERLGLPLLGICFGMQALNVSRGGSLIQDIDSQVDDNIRHDQGRPYDRPSHSLRVDDASILASLESVKAANSAVRVNSSHHQAVNRVGANLRATAWASDGVIECIEDTRSDRFALGVQWHPEITFGNDQLSREIFELFVSRCREGRVVN